MDNLRTCGTAPYRVAVLHGGPSAPGEMAPVARELAAERGVLEPLQTATSLAGQVQELRAVLAGRGALPLTPVGFSWGAMLGFIFAAQHPALVKKLILVSSGVYQERYAARIKPTRLARLSQAGRREANALMAAPGKDAALARLEALFTRADSYNPLTLDTEALAVQHNLHRRLWQEARALRASDRLLALGRRIRCPVVAIPGNHNLPPARRGAGAALRRAGRLPLHSAGALRALSLAGSRGQGAILRNPPPNKALPGRPATASAQGGPAELSKAGSVVRSGGCPPPRLGRSLAGLPALLNRQRTKD